MNVAMVKHGGEKKIYWFEVPDNLIGSIKPSVRVAYDTARGIKCGVVIGSVVNDEDVHDLMVESGATFPLRKIVATPTKVALDSITIPHYMKHSCPNDKKIAKRFLEYYHNKRFDTNVVVYDNGMLEDGYTAYLVAKELKLSYIPAIVYHNTHVENNDSQYEGN